MKSKKLIAFLCAATMTTSAFAGLTITASAASEPVLSLDGSSTAGWTTNDTVQLTSKTDEGSTDSYLDFLSAYNKNSSDTVYNLPAAAQLTDDYVIEFDTLLNTGNGMGRLNQYTQVAFTGANPGHDTADYGGDYASSAQHLIDDNGYTNTWNKDANNIGQGYTTQIAASVTSRIELQGKWIFNMKNTTPNIATDGDAQIGDGKWVRVRAAVKNGKATITAADSNQVYVDEQQFDADATKLSQILLSFGRSDTQNFIPTTPTNIKLDNIKVYDGVANAPAFSTTGLRATAIVATPIPAVEKVAGAAPALTIPDRSGIDPVTSVQTSFNALQVGELAHIATEAQEPVAVGDKMEVQLGSRASGPDAATYASVVKTADGDNAIKLNAAQFSTNGRGPVLSLKDNMSIADLTGTNSVLGFSAYLSKTQADGMSKLYLFDDVDLSAEGGNVDGNGVARYVLAVITTEDVKDEEGNNKYTNGDSNIGIHVDEGWHTFTVAVSDGAYRVFVDQQYKDDAGKLSPVLKNTKVGTGDTSKAVVNLPAFAVENRKSDDGTQYSSVLIDNVVAYMFQGDLDKAAEYLPKSGEAAVETPAPTEVPKHTATITWDKTTSSATVSTTEETAFDGVLVHMSYNDDNTLKSVKTYDAKGIVKTTPKAVAFDSTDKVYNGDKIVLWNSLESMIPYGSLTVANGETKPTPTPTATTAPTPTATTTATTAPTPTATTTATTAPTPTATTAPTATPTAVPTYAVTTAAAQNGTVTVTGADDLTAVTAGTELTITATPNSGFRVGTITVAPTATSSTTVVAVDSTKYTFTMPAEPVKVTVTFEVDPAIYRLKTDGLTSGQISYKLAFADVADQTGFKPTNDEVALCNVPDFGTATTKVEAIPALDGWGYKHQANQGAGIKDTKGNVARQTSASVDTAANALIVNGDGGAGGRGTVSFIPANANVTLPSSGTVIYTFDAVLSGENKDAKDAIFGLTGAADGASLDSLGSTSIQIPANTTSTLTKPVVITYDVASKGYTIAVDGETKASGVATKAATGIYVQSTNSYQAAGIKNLVVTSSEDKLNVVNVTPSTAEDNGGTFTVDKKVIASTATADDRTVTISTTPAAGKKVSAVTVAKAEGTVTTTPLTGADAGKYTFEMPAEDVTVTVTFTVADAAAVTVAGGVDTITKGTTAATAFTATVKDAADVDITAGKTVTWGVESADTEVATLNEGTTVSNDGKLTVAAAETATKVKVTATVDGVTGKSAEVTVTSIATYTASVDEEIENGTVVIDNETKTNPADTAINLTVTPAEGYEIATVTYKGASDETATPITKTGEKYSFAMPAKDVTVSATFTKITYTITNNALEADKATNGGFVAVAGTPQVGEEITITVTPNEGKVLDTLTVTKPGDPAPVAITVTNNKFTMPSANVTVSATFKAEVMSYTATLAHTNDAVWGSGTNHGTSAGLDAATEHFNNEANGTWGGAAYIQFSGLSGRAASALLTLHINQGGRSGRTSKLYYLADNIDLTTVANDALYGGAKTWVADVITSKTGEQDVTVDVTKAVAAMAQTGKVTFYLTNNAGGADINGKAAATGAPALSVVNGRNVTFTSTDTENELTVVVKDKETTPNTVATVTVTNGTGSAVLPEGEYTYEMAAQHGYNAIEATDLTVGKRDITQALALVATPKSDVTFTSSATNFDIVVKLGEDTVAPKEANGKVYSLIQGETYSYTITPTGADATAYAPASGTYAVTTDATQTKNVTLTALSTVTFTSNATNFTVLVKDGETTVNPTADNAKVYLLNQGKTYTYTITPTDTDANAYDPKTATVEVGTNATQTVNVTLDAKTYSITVSGVPGYAQIYTGTSEDNGATVTYGTKPVARTDHTGKVISQGDGTAEPTAVAATNVVADGVAANSKVYYKVTKSGYTDLTGSLDITNADANIAAITMAPTDTNVLFYDDGDWMHTVYTDNQGGAFGGWNFRGDKSPKYISSQTKRQAAVFNPNLTAENEYIFSFNTTALPAGGAANQTSIHQVKDSSGKVLATLCMSNGDTADRSATYITAGDYTTTVEGAKATSGYVTEGNNTFSVRVNQTTGLVTVSYNGQTVSDTITGAGVINTVHYAPDGGDKLRIGLDSFKISKVTE